VRVRLVASRRRLAVRVAQRLPALRAQPTGPEEDESTAHYMVHSLLLQLQLRGVVPTDIDP